MINIDTVYQKVLAIANKEQRGYVTPQEFNLFANQAQLFIFEQYFYDLNQFARMPSVGIEFSDVDEKIDEKLSVFKITASAQTGTASSIGTLNSRQFTFPIGVHKLGTIWNENPIAEIHKVDHREIAYIHNSPLAAPTVERPVYVLDGDPNLFIGMSSGQISVFPDTVTSITFRYIRIPARVEWGYTVVNTQAQYNATSPSTQHFELHPSDEVELVTKILEYAGIVMKDPSLYQMAEREEQKTIQQEKQ